MKLEEHAWGDEICWAESANGASGKLLHLNKGCIIPVASYDTNRKYYVHAGKIDIVFVKMSADGIGEAQDHVEVRCAGSFYIAAHTFHAILAEDATDILVLETRETC